MKSQLQLTILVLVGLFIFNVAFFSSRNNSFSIFYKFDPEALETQALQRRDQALQALKDLELWIETEGKNQKTPLKFPLLSNTISPEICVGISTYLRTSGRDQLYLSQVVAALLTRIHPLNHSSVYLHVFNSYLPPEYHTELDRIKKFVTVSNINYSDIRILEFPEILKQSFDYAYVLKFFSKITTCKSILMLEDDALSSTRWYEKIQKSIQSIPEKYKQKWSTLKLFVPRDFSSWEDSASSFGLLILFSIISSSITYLILCVFFKFRFNDHRLIFPSFKFFSGLVLIYVIFFICIGKQNIFHRTSGIYREHLGWSTTAVLYSNSEDLKALIDFLEMKIDDFLRSDDLSILPVDLLINDFVNRRHMSWVELVVVPDLFQHIGWCSSMSHRRKRRMPIFSMNFPDDDVPILFDLVYYNS